jgi:hypothetical protein
MKKYIISLVIVGYIFFISWIYKLLTNPLLIQFPVEQNVETTDSSTLFLLLFFSINNCSPCLDVIDTLNSLSTEFSVIGVVPDIELESESEVRRITGATFPLDSLNNFKKYIPHYAPTLYGVNNKDSLI